MARARRTTTAGVAQPKSSAEFKCPECGKSFTRAASLGAHRNRAHGVTGASKRGTIRQTASASGASTDSRRRRRTATRPSSSGSATTRRRNGVGTIDRNHLLQTLFPDGVPPREDVIRRLGSWLDEAERLAKL